MRADARSVHLCPVSARLRLDLFTTACTCVCAVSHPQDAAIVDVVLCYFGTALHVLEIHSLAATCFLIPLLRSLVSSSFLFLDVMVGCGGHHAFAHHDILLLLFSHFVMRFVQICRFFSSAARERGLLDDVLCMDTSRPMLAARSRTMDW